MHTSRRALIAAAAITPALAARPAWGRTLSRGSFTHGVASGDPLPDGVVLWTRFAHVNEGRTGWEVAEDDAFARIVRRGEARAPFTTDFCAKVDVRGLQPDRRYFYRFLSADGASETGRTRTAPARGADSLTVALFSCANYPFGYFHAYGHAAARDDIDLALHVGDYIYEVQRGQYPGVADAVANRIIEPHTETVSLSDYYRRYASYHTDPDLRALRAAKPMSVVWDDHELANDTWREGAQAHDPNTEGDFFARIAAASKAYFDWMPIRLPERRGQRIYRSLDWGDLARVLLLDTRFIGRDRQLDYRTTIGPRLAAGEDVAALAAEFRPLLEDPDRSLLGAAQERWLADALAASKGAGHTWQVLAQQIQVAPQMAPGDITRLIGPEISAGGRVWFETAQQLTPLGLPWNLDNWNGYPAARARLLRMCAEAGANALILGGDSHNCWANNLPAANGQRMAALEFAGGSVSSPGMERTLNAAAPGERESLLRGANPQLAFCDATRRGYGAITLTREACNAEWVAFADVRTPVSDEPIVTRLNATPSASNGPSAWAVS
jgi:alkaline phosphatase D